MAEKYGEIPPLFTKKWWEYFWDYYKIHTIVVVCVLIAILITVVQVRNRKEYDLNVIFGTYSYLDDTAQQALKTNLEEMIYDTNNDGEKNLLFLYHGFSDKIEQTEYNTVLEARFMLNLEEDYSFIYIVDSKTAPMLLDLDYCDEMYTSCKEIGANGEQGLKGADGICYGYPLKNSSILKNNNIKSDDLYLILRKNFKEDKPNKDAYENALNLAKELIK